MNGISISKAQRIAVRAARGMGLKRELTRPHELLLFAKLSSSNETYNLSLDDSLQKAILPIAEGLKDRDGFLAVAYAMGFIKVPIINDTAYPGVENPVYHADPNVFNTAATVDLSEAQQIRSFYWGRHSIKTNEGLRINEAPNLRFLTVPQTQASASTANQNVGDELKEIGALIRFGGGDDNEIIIKTRCADKSLLGGPATSDNYLFFRLCGAIIKGATNKAYLR